MAARSRRAGWMMAGPIRAMAMSSRPVQSITTQARSRIGAMGRGRGTQLGQILPLFILVLSAVLSALGLALDGANLYAAQRAAQGAADLAALAGAFDLPGAPTTATASAQSFLSKNGQAAGPDVTVVVTTPFGGDSRRIEVRVTRTIGTYFLPVLGVRTMNVTARAVARSGAPAYTIFAGRNACAAGDSQQTINWTG